MKRKKANTVKAVDDEACSLVLATSASKPKIAEITKYQPLNTVVPPTKTPTDKGVVYLWRILVPTTPTANVHRIVQEAANFRPPVAASAERSEAATHPAMKAAKNRRTSAVQSQAIMRRAFGASMLSNEKNPIGRIGGREEWLPGFRFGGGDIPIHPGIDITQRVTRGSYYL